MKNNFKLNYKKLLSPFLMAGFLFVSPVFVQASDVCQNDCSFWGEHQCNGVYGRSCGSNSITSCLEWSAWQNCNIQCFYCGDKTCNSQCGESPSNCSKDCKNPNPLPTVNMGNSKEIWEGGIVVLDASAFDSEGELMTYRWTCTGGYLSDPNIINPTYFASEVTKDTSYTCALKVQDFRGGTAAGSIWIKVKERIPSLDIENTVRNISQKQVSWQNIISALPSDKVEFRVEITATSTTDVSNILLLDILPSGLFYAGNLKIDGIPSSANLTKSLKIGNLERGKLKTVTFETQVLPLSSFSIGTTALTNIVQARADFMAEVSGKASINVIRAPNQVSSNNNENKIQGVLGVTSVAENTDSKNPTSINTGFTNRILDTFLFPLFVAGILVFAFKSKILWLEEWLDERRKHIRKYQTQSVLSKKINYFKNHEKEIYETWKK